MSTDPPKPVQPTEDTWERFLYTISRPWFLVAVVTTLTLLVASIIIADPAAKAFFAFLAAAAGGYAGDRYAEASGASTQRKVLEQSGRDAVRNLRNVARNLDEIRARTVQHIYTVEQHVENLPLAQERLQHVVSDIDSTMRLVTDGIESWIEIVPGVHYLVELEQLQPRYQDLLDERDEIRAQLERRDDSEDEADTLRQQLKATESELKKVRQEAQRLRDSAANSGLVSGYTPTVMSSSGRLINFDPLLGARMHMGTVVTAPIPTPELDSSPLPGTNTGTVDGGTGLLYNFGIGDLAPGVLPHQVTPGTKVTFTVVGLGSVALGGLRATMVRPTLTGSVSAQ